jgi:hypothetical protein
VDQPLSVEIRRITISLPEALLLDTEEVNLKLRREGVRVSFSSLVEVALKELIRLNNVAAVLKRHGATARRSTNHKPPETDDVPPKLRIAGDGRA